MGFGMATSFAEVCIAFGAGRGGPLLGFEWGSSVVSGSNLLVRRADDGDAIHPSHERGADGVEDWSISGKRARS